MSSANPYDAILILSFGGPEGRDDVIPFLENVLRGKPVPRERLLEVAEHYYHYDGISPINEQCRELLTALRVELDASGINLPVYWGNRNWNPLLPETMAQMKRDGVRRVLTYVTSGFSCYSGCRQYRENIQAALSDPEIAGMEVHKIRVFFNHPDFIDVLSEHVGHAVQQATESGQRPFVAFTAHSIPMSMASTSDYQKQLQETCRLVAERLHLPADSYRLVYQSRSGRPEDPWLEPDILDFVKELHGAGQRSLVISPVGFLSDHMEVLYDLDDAAKHLCDEYGMTMVRARTPGSHPQFVRMIRKLIQERLQGAVQECVGLFPANHDVCPVDCCPAPVRPAAGRRPEGVNPGGGRP